ncbi:MULTISPECIES: helix-turn-helix domain-containing protein [Myroides]|uniref:Helix-turn-helix domain-containing protein n=1 Tax=Myroides albus TaxID=2562892 RepID=A0A6I3LJ13_9FLAO|nr:MULTISPECIES: helix-turn-helix domain-containing protein [Myroides]MTG98233.1 helix-turn-helix domain-containing protein [Myroides albus]MVX35016.1 helix-turn-helix domain-containing protein [Myroides sp. LoEW2-1]UVD79040.1 helix-turn-helix domain-containing protein [Myroides albus]
MPYNNEIVTYSQGPNAVGGIYVKDHNCLGKKSQMINHTHRDDYYVISIATNGAMVMDCELNKFQVKRNSILIVKPYQIHSLREITEDYNGYFLGVQDFRIPNHLSDLLFTIPGNKQLISISEEDLSLLTQTFDLMRCYMKKDNTYQTQIINGLFSTALHKICSLVESEHPITDLALLSQPALITSKFKRLITHQTHLNLPSFFASQLNITTAHLNDCVKKTTGQTASYWLKKSIIDEAKRLLYYTDKTVKEIAFNLGFEDHTYFSRMFKKNTYQTPLEFRIEYR